MCIRDSLGAAELAQQAALAGHAEGAADRTTDLTGDAQAVARQQYAFDHLPVGQLHQQARGTVGARVLGADPGQLLEAGGDGRQPLTHRKRQEILGLLVLGTGIQCLSLIHI